jgi:hypothetical protein
VPAFDSLVGWIERHVPGQDALPELRLVRAALVRNGPALTAPGAAGVRVAAPLDLGAHNLLFVEAWRATPRTSGSATGWRRQWTAAARSHAAPGRGAGRG